MHEKVGNAFTAVLVVCAVVVTGLLVHREHEARATAREVTHGVRIPQWNALLAESRFAEARDAEVAVAVFGDYTCRYCRQLEATLDSILPTFGGKVAIVHQHFPIVPDGVAFSAALAAECAAEQGRFEAYHRLLYDAQENLPLIHSNAAWDSLGVIAEVPDLAEFRSCVYAQRPAAAVHASRRQADQIGVVVTPTLMINGRMFRGAAPADRLMERIGVALARNEAG